MKIKDLINSTAIRKYRKIFSITLASLFLASSFPVKGGTSSATPIHTTLAAAAASDFVYVIRSSQSFGDVSSGGDFQGEFKEYTFNLPTNLVASGVAHVMAHSKGLSNSCNRFEINGVGVGILASRNSGELFVEMGDIPSNVLKPGVNKLLIRSVNSSCGAGGDLDEFLISNVVIFYKVQ